MVRRLGVILPLTLLFSSTIYSQQSVIKSYSSYEDYCADNPHAPTCVNGKPLKIQNLDLNPMAGYCREHPRSPGCESYCRENPKALKCLDTSSYRTQGSHPSNSQNLHSPGPSIINVPDAPSRAAAPATKGLALASSWRFAHPRADLLLGINAAALRQSTTLRSLLAQLAAALQMKPAELESTLAQTGDVDQCWMSIRSGDALLLLQGRMNAPDGFVNLANGMTSWRISKTAVVLGTQASVRAAVQRLQGPAGIEAAGARQMKELAADNDVWLVGTRAMLSQVHIATGANDLSGYVLGFSFRDGLKAELKVNYATLAGARRALAALRNSPPPAASAIHISSEIEGTALRMKVLVEQQELSRAMSQALAAPPVKQLVEMAGRTLRSSDQMVIYGAGGSRTVQPSTPAPAPPGKLVIYGLPGGPKVM